jgi:Tol biopolymer transport system component
MGARQGGRRIRGSRGSITVAAALVFGGSGFAQGGSTSLVSRSSTGAQALAGIYTGAGVSSGGRYVAFDSEQGDLVPGDTNGSSDVFVHDRLTGQTTRVSVSSAGQEANDKSCCPWISADGRYVAFSSGATNLAPGDANGTDDAFLHDRLLGTTEILSLAPNGTSGNGFSAGASLSADGRYAEFFSDADDLVPGDGNHLTDIFVRDRVAGTTSRVSVSSSGTEADGECDAGTLSADGRWVLFSSYATNLVPGIPDENPDVFLHDRSTGTTALVSKAPDGSPASNGTFIGSLSADGRFATFGGGADNLVPGDTNSCNDTFLYDRLADTIVRLSVSPSGVQSDGNSGSGSISADGRYVAFYSEGTNLVAGDANARADVFLRDRQTGETTLVSVASSGAQGDRLSDGGSISADGAFVVFRSQARTLVPRDANGFVPDAFLRELAGCSPTVATFCAAGKSGGGCSPWLSGSGAPSASANSGFTIAASGADAQAFAIVFYGVSGPKASPYGAGAGTQCVANPIQRMGLVPTSGQGGACDGSFSVDWNAYRSGHPNALGAPFMGGETVWAQAWCRGPGGAVLSNGVWFAVCP